MMSAFGIISTTIIEQNIAAVSDDSTVAFQTADTGAEQAFYELRNRRIATLDEFDGATCSGGTVTATGVNGVSNAVFEISFYDEGGDAVTGCGSTSGATDVIRSAKSIGYFGKAVRAVEIAVSVPTDDIEPDVSYWTFDGDLEDDTGTHDANPYGGISTTSTGTIPVDGLAGAEVLSFNGTDEYASIGSSADFDFTDSDSYTISLWVWFDSVSGDQAIISKHLGFTLESDGDNWIYQGLTASTPAIETGRWYHVVLWQDGGAGTRALYVDGSLVNDNASIDADDNEDIYLGVRNAGSVLTDFFDGKIDDMRFYGDALDYNEIIILCENDFDNNSGHPEGVTCGG